MYISYSGFSSYEKCPRMYYHRYIAHTIPPEPDNRVNMLYGSITGKVFEQFYNEKMWRIPNYVDVMLSRVSSIAEETIREETSQDRRGIVNWGDPKSNYDSLEKLLDDVRLAIPRGVAAIRHHRLAGKIASAETKLDGTIGGHRLGGRCDFLIHRVAPHNDVCILDGKGTKWQGQYVDTRQLRWYSMLHQHKFDRLPDRSGFLYWRSEVPETSVEWVEVTAEAIGGLRDLVVETCQTIEQTQRSLPVVPTREQLTEAFPARPNRDDCKWCAYLSTCDEGTSFMGNRGKAPISDVSGVEDVGI